MQDNTLSRPTILPRISPSNISDLSCLKKFHTLRMLNQWPTATGFSQAGQFGIGVHAVLRDIYSPQRQHRPDLANLETYAWNAFQELRYPSEITRLREIERCISIVRNYVRQDDSEDATSTIAVERFGEFPIALNGKTAFFLLARIDRTIRRGAAPTHLVVRDYKLAKPRVKMEETFIQLWVAKLMFPEFRTYSAEIDWIDEDGRVERDVITPHQLKGTYSLVMSKIDRLLDAVATNEFPAEPGELCTFCPLRPKCQPSRPTDIESANELFVGGKNEGSEANV